MSCLMLLPVVLLVFGLIGSLVVLWKKNTEAGADNGHKSLSRRRISWLLGGSVFLCALFWLWLAVQQQESTLTIHPVSRALACLTVFPSGIISTQTAFVLKVSPRKKTAC
jgi:uncharacterized membrane protein YbhN (UPF0104 family)